MIYFEELWVELCIILIPALFIILYKRRLSIAEREKDFNIFLENRCGCYKCNKDDEFKLLYLCNKIKGYEYIVTINDKEKEDFIIYIKNKYEYLTFLQTISMYKKLLDYKYVKLCKKYDFKIKVMKSRIGYNVRDVENKSNNKLLKNNKIDKLFRKINNIYVKLL